MSGIVVHTRDDVDIPGWMGQERAWNLVRKKYLCLVYSTISLGFVSSSSFVHSAIVRGMVIQPLCL